MNASRGSHYCRIPKALLCVAALRCGERPDPVRGRTPRPDTGPAFHALILSNPSVPGGPDTAGSRDALVDAVAYASLPPGSMSDTRKKLVLFTNLTTGAGATVVVANGGFDPVPIPAVVGDSLRIRIQFDGQAGERDFYAKLAPRRPPRVVRSSPSPGRSDVPLSSRMYVVFSEPMSAALLADSAVHLSADGVQVPGTLAFADSAHLSVSFTPAEPLGRRDELQPAHHVIGAGCGRRWARSARRHLVQHAEGLDATTRLDRIASRLGVAAAHGRTRCATLRDVQRNGHADRA